MREITAADVVAKACAAAFGKRLVVNNLRSLLVEAMIAEALSPRWAWVSADWAGWDFQNADGVRLEVKQSAAKQTWAKEPSPPGKCCFDIAARTGHWIGDKWIDGHRRNADIYILAHHPIVDPSADHRDPHQWRFYVVRETALLPASKKTISLSGVQQLVSPVGFEELAARVEQVAVELTTAGG